MASQQRLSLMALKIRSYLVSKASRHLTISYSELAEHFDLPATGNQLGRILSPLLDEIFNWCHTRKLPYLTAIVVRKSGQDANLPGQGFWETFKPNSSLSKMEKEAWTKILQQDAFSFWSGF